MKYRTYSVTLVIFFLLVAAGFATGYLSTGTQDSPPAPSANSPDLQVIMRLLLSDVDRINEGIYTQSYGLIETAAAGINNHPPLPENTLTMLKETLGNRMEAFAKFDQIVHSRADSLREAAGDEDMGRVLENYRIIQQGCVNCHAAFQDEVRQERLKRRLQKEESDKK